MIDTGYNYTYSSEINEIPSRMPLKNALNAKKPQWFNFSFLVFFCGILSIALISFSFGVALGILPLPVFSILVFLVLLLSSLFSSFIIQRICCRANAFDYGTYWFAVSDELLNHTNWSNRYLDWFFRRMRREKEKICDSEAIQRITESLVCNTIAPWYVHIGNNEVFSQDSCLALEQALTNISRLVKRVDMRSLLTDLTLITHRHLKKQGMCQVTGKPFRAEHPVSLGKSSLDCYLDTQVTILIGDVLPQYAQDGDCALVKMFKQVIRRIVMKKIRIIRRKFDQQSTVEECKENKEAHKRRLSMFD